MERNDHWRSSGFTEWSVLTLCRQIAHIERTHLTALIGRATPDPAMVCTTRTALNGISQNFGYMANLAVQAVTYINQLKRSTWRALSLFKLSGGRDGHRSSIRGSNSEQNGQESLGEEHF